MPAIAVPEKWLSYLLREPETGMNYQIASVWLDDGTRYDQVVISGGYITQVRGYNDVPFSGEQIDRIKVTHKKWDFNQDRRERGHA